MTSPPYRATPRYGSNKNGMREKEDLLMRDLFASSVSYINCVGGLNSDSPTSLSRGDFNNIEAILLNNDARTMLESIDAMDKFSTGPTRDAFICLANTALTTDLQNVQGVLLKNAYPSQEGLRPEEYCSISRFRVFVSSKAAKKPGASQLGRTVYTLPMFGLCKLAEVKPLVIDLEARRGNKGQAELYALAA